MTHDLGGTIPQALHQAAASFARQAAIVDGTRRVTFAELKLWVDRLSRAFLAAGLAPGDRFAVWAPNIAEWVAVALAGQQVGCILVPVNTRLKGPEAGDIIRRASVRLAFCIGDFLGLDYTAVLRRQPCPELEYVVSLRGRERAPLPLGAFERLGDAIPDAALQRRVEAVMPEDISDILYTSGTTGAPKGAMTTHGQNVAVFEAWSEAVGLSERDRYLIVNPFSHAFGYKAGWLAALLRGTTIYPLATFDVQQVLRYIEKYAISMLPGPPILFQSLLAHPATRKADLRSLRCAVTGAASVPVQLVKEMKERLGFDAIYTAYGLTESSGVVSLCRAGDDLDTIANTCGRAMDGVEIRIADALGRPLPAGAAGEVRVRGFNVMRGYLDDPDGTAAAITRDGWLRTGDVGVLDDRGYLRIVDRLKDLYICGGFNCYPAEIENRLLDHPDIAEVAVVGAPDSRFGEVGHAFAVRAPGSAPAADDVLAWATARLANYKVPRRLVWVDELPRNASGKVQKYLLRSH